MLRGMTVRLILWLLLAGVMAAPARDVAVAPVPPRIVKVLPHLLDKKGRHTLAPSLLERDAYQAVLRKDPSKQGGIRFDVQCRGLRVDPGLTLRIEARGTKDRRATSLTLEKTLEGRDRTHAWQALSVLGDQHDTFGQLVAWRASLWSGGKQVAEQKSFLW
jgi:hypothetical protein